MDRTKRSKSAKAAKREALRAAVLARKENKASALDEYTVNDQGDIYDEVDEEEYKDIVEKVREKKEKEVKQKAGPHT